MHHRAMVQLVTVAAVLQCVTSVSPSRSHLHVISHVTARVTGEFDRTSLSDIFTPLTISLPQLFAGVPADTCCTSQSSGSHLHKCGHSKSNLCCMFYRLQKYYNSWTLVKVLLTECDPTTSQSNCIQN